MKRFLGIPRRWWIAAGMIVLAAALTVPWTFWIMLAAYERDVNEKASMLADRVKLQLSSNWWWKSEQMLDPLRTELMGDSTHIVWTGRLGPALRTAGTSSRRWCQRPTRPTRTPTSATHRSTATALGKRHASGAPVRYRN